MQWAVFAGSALLAWAQGTIPGRSWRFQLSAGVIASLGGAFVVQAFSQAHAGLAAFLPLWLVLFVVQVRAALGASSGAGARRAERSEPPAPEPAPVRSAAPTDTDATL